MVNARPTPNIQTKERDGPDANCADECARECKDEDGAEVAEEVLLRWCSEYTSAAQVIITHLLELITRIQDDWRQQQVEEQSMSEGLRQMFVSILVLTISSHDHCVSRGLPRRDTLH